MEVVCTVAFFLSYRECKKHGTQSAVSFCSPWSGIDCILERQLILKLTMILLLNGLLLKI